MDVTQPPPGRISVVQDNDGLWMIRINIPYVPMYFDSNHRWETRIEAVFALIQANHKFDRMLLRDGAVLAQRMKELGHL